jgi:hypothetical protein
MRAHIASLLALAAAAPGLAHADDPPPTPAAQVARGQARLYPVLPTLRLGASTEDSSMVQASLSIRTSMTDYWLVDIAPTVSIVSPSGLSGLFSSSTSNGTKTWAAGLTISFVGYNGDPFRKEHQGQPELAAAYASCRARCTGSGQTVDEVDFCGQYENQPTLPDSMDPSALCARGKRTLHAAGHALLPVYGAHPTYLVSLGGLVNGAHFDYYERDQQMVLQPTSSTKIGGTGAFSFTYVHQFLKKNALSVELALVYDRTWKPGLLARDCSPVGTTMFSVVETCPDVFVGAPVPVNRIFFPIEVGYVDVHTDPKDHNKARSLWRGAAGPVLDIIWGDQTETRTRIGIAAPIYLNVSAVFGLNSPVYKGLIRVTPSLNADYTSRLGWTPVVLLKVDVLGDRYMFNRALDWR